MITFEITYLLAGIIFLLGGLIVTIAAYPGPKPSPNR